MAPPPAIIDGPSASPKTVGPTGGAGSASTATGSGGGAKRSRPSGAGGAAPARTKRRKPEPSDTDGGGKGATGASAAAKGKEGEELGESGEIVTRVDFNDLPSEALYKYLEYHDLLPRWDPSPWSEAPCTTPNALYSAAPPPPPQPPSPKDRSTPLPTNPPTSQTIVPEIQPPQAGEPSTTSQEPSQNPPAEGEIAKPEEGAEEVNGGMDVETEGGVETTPAPPTTRSKTLPWRKPETPPEPSPQPEEIKRGVITLSDVEASQAVLAEKANAHWVKGLGGGQNKEGETIVNFLYKLKAGPTRLLRVYNP